MKKSLVYLAGIVLLFTILVTGACQKGIEPGHLATVKIYVKHTLIDGEMHLEMYDSNNPGKVVVDNLYTDVAPGSKVKWKWVKGSEKMKFVKIGPPIPGEIIPRDAKKVFLSRNMKLRIPEDAPIPKDEKIRGNEEKYDIVFVDGDGKRHEIDPYLKIPHTVKKK